VQGIRGLACIDLQEFLRNGYSVSSKDVIIILALEERIKRACEMFALARAYLKSFAEDRQQIIDIQYPATVVLGAVIALPLPAGRRSG
jgi:hypothetical protein